MNIQQKDTFPAIIKSELKDYNIVTMAVPGYSIIQELEMLKDRGLELQPDMIIWQYTLNDPVDIEGPPLTILSYKEIIKREDQILEKIGLSKECKQSNLKNIRILHVLREQYENHFTNRGKDLLFRSYDPLYKKISEYYTDKCSFARVQYAFKELGMIQQENNITVKIIITPVLQDFQNYLYKDIHDQIRTEAEKNGLFVYDLFDYLSQFESDKLAVVYFDPIHYDEDGHMLIAKYLLKRI